MTHLECCKCGVSFGMTNQLYEGRKRDREAFFCPNGHAQAFVDSLEEKMRKARDRAIQEQARLAEENAIKEKEILRLKKRSANGVCPCCTRTFTNMARHMKTKHPEILADNVVKIASKRKP